MTPEQLDQVQASYATLGRAAPEMAMDFYGRLFAADPSAEALFTQGPEVMADKFADELDAIVQAITSFDTFAPRVRDLALRHVGYGVQTQHYHAVGEALIGALAAHLAGVMGRRTRGRMAAGVQPRGRDDDGDPAEVGGLPRRGHPPMPAGRRTDRLRRDRHHAGWSSAAARRMPSPIAAAMRSHAAAQASRTSAVNSSPRPCSRVQSSAAPTTSKCSGRTP